MSNDQKIIGHNNRPTADGVTSASRSKIDAFRNRNRSRVQVFESFETLCEYFPISVRFVIVFASLFYLVVPAESEHWYARSLARAHRPINFTFIDPSSKTPKQDVIVSAHADKNVIETSLGNIGGPDLAELTVSNASGEIQISSWLLEQQDKGITMNLWARGYELTQVHISNQTIRLLDDRADTLIQLSVTFDSIPRFGFVVADRTRAHFQVNLERPLEFPLIPTNDTWEVLRAVSEIFPGFPFDRREIFSHTIRGTSHTRRAIEIIIESYSQLETLVPDSYKRYFLGVQGEIPEEDAISWKEVPEKVKLRASLYGTIISELRELKKFYCDAGGC